MLAYLLTISTFSSPTVLSAWLKRSLKRSICRTVHSEETAVCCTNSIARPDVRGYAYSGLTSQLFMRSVRCIVTWFRTNNAFWYQGNSWHSDIIRARPIVDVHLLWHLWYRQVLSSVVLSRTLYFFVFAWKLSCFIKNTRNVIEVRWQHTPTTKHVQVGLPG